MEIDQERRLKKELANIQALVVHELLMIKPEVGMKLHHI